MPRRTIILIAALGLISVSLVFGFAVVQQQFSERGKKFLLEKLSEEGVESEIGELTYDAFKGIIARDVRIFATEARQVVTASFEELIVDVDFGRMAGEEDYLRSVDVRGGALSISPGEEEPESERRWIREIDARVRIPERALEIPEVTFVFEGVDVRASGSVLLDDSVEGMVETEKQEEILDQLRVVVRRLSEELEKLEFENEQRPMAELSFTANLAEEDSVATRWIIKAPAGRRGVFRWNEASLQGRFEHRHFRVEQFKLIDGFGSLEADADYALGGDFVDFRVRSSIDLYGLLRSVFPVGILGEFSLASPPDFEGSGRFHLAGAGAQRELPLEMTGRFSCEEFVSHGVPFLGLHMDFSVDGDRRYFRNILLDHESGSVSGRILFEGEQVRYAMVIDMDPTVLRPFFFDENVRKELDRFAFGESPNVTIDFEGSGPAEEPENWTTTGNFTLGPFYYNAVDVQAAVGRFVFDPEKQRFHEFRVDRREGAITGDEVVVENKSGLARIKNVRGAVWPEKLAAYFAPDAAKHLEQYRFEEPPQLQLDGYVDAVAGIDNNLKVLFQSWRTGRYELFGKELLLASPSGEVQLGKGNVKVVVNAGMFGEGKAKLEGDFALSDNKAPFSLRYEIEDAAFNALATTYDFVTETKGNLGGHFACRRPSEGAALEGEGEVHMADGNIFSIPLFGPLSKILSAIFPDSLATKATYSVATEGKATLTLRDGKLRTEDLEAFTPAFRLRARGDVDVETQDVSFDAWMNFRRPLPSLVFLPVSRLLEYEAEGTMSDPQWRPTNFSLPGKIAERLGLRRKEEAAEVEAEVPEEVEAESPDGERRNSSKARKGPLGR
ncbi:MAG: hypothetical protein AAGA58_13915 [Verrucomicrobiota bacterium]